MRAVVVPGTIVHETGSIGTSARTMSSVRSGPVPSAWTVTLTVVPASPRTSWRPRRWSCRRSAWPSTATMTSPTRRPGALGRAALEDADDARQAVLGRIDADADADVRAGQRIAALLAFLGGHEVGVAGVADRLGQAVDGAVDELLVVELVAPDVLAVDGVPGLLDERRTGRSTPGDAGSGVVAVGPPAAATSRLRPRSRR